MTLRRWHDYVNGTRVIGSVNIPNPKYRGHRGYVLRVMQDLESDDFLVEVRWDTGDEPVEGLTHQVMSLRHMDLDPDWQEPGERHIIQEESLTGP